MDTLQVTPDLDVFHLGPPLEKGRLPAIFYFALSARESLELDPYNQPVSFLLNHQFRVFSFNLPAHGPNLNAIDAIGVWAKEFEKGNDPLSPFFDQVIMGIEALISKGFIFREKIGFMGLSRGGFIAMHIAARSSLPRAIVSFAPMIDLQFASEFENLQEDRKVLSFTLLSQVPKLYAFPLKIYIGNRDIRVGTEKSFSLASQLAEEAFQNGLRSPPVEMVITPSIGHKGHGTSKEVFESGAHWVGKTLGVIR